MEREEIKREKTRQKKLDEQSRLCVITLEMPRRDLEKLLKDYSSFRAVGGNVIEGLETDYDLLRRIHEIEQDPWSIEPFKEKYHRHHENSTPPEYGYFLASALISRKMIGDADSEFKKRTAA